MYRLNDQLIFIAHPKIASRSCQRALQDQVGATQIGGRHDIDERQVDEVRKAGGSIACSVRNPFDVFVSWYFHGVIGNAVRKKRYGGVDTPMEAWLPGVMHAGNGYIERGLFYGDIHCDTIIRYENLVPEFTQWVESCGCQPVTLDHRGKATLREGRPYQVFYTELSRKFVTDFCVKELEKYDYEFDPLGEFDLTPKGFYGKV